MAIDQFMRQAEVLIEGMSFTEPDYRIYFKINFDTDLTADKGQIEIHNLSSESIANISKGTNVILNAGYLNDVGTIYAGSVQSVKTTFDGGERTTTIKALDANDQILNGTVNKSYAPGVKASYIIMDMLSSIGLEIGAFNLANDITYINGKVLSGSILNALKSIVIGDCNSKIYINKAIVTIRPYGDGDNIGFLLNSNTGLLSSPEKIDRNPTDKNPQADYSMTMLLNHRVSTDSILQVESISCNGLYRAVKGYHQKTDADFTTYAEVITV